MGGVAHENVEVRRGLRGDGVVAELNKLRSLAAGILTLKQVANAFFARCVGQYFVAAVIILTAADRFALMKFHHVIFDADSIHVRRIALAVVRFHLVKGFAFVFLRFLFKHRIQRTVQQERIDRLPGSVPVRQRSVLHVLILKHAVRRPLFRFGHLMAVRVSKQLAADQQRPQSHGKFPKMCSQHNTLIPFYKNADVIL